MSTNLPNEIAAILFFDSWTDHCPDLRDADEVENRHLIYHGDNVILDLLVRPMPNDRSLRVSGQILNGTSKMDTFDAVSNLVVSMAHDDESVLSVRTNRLGEFIFNGIPDDIWNLTIAFGKRHFVVRGLSGRRPRPPLS